MLLAQECLLHARGEQYWNDVGSLQELMQGTFDALRGELHLPIEGEERAPGVTVAPATELPADTEIEGTVWVGREAQIGPGVRLMGPVVLGAAAAWARAAGAREHPHARHRAPRRLDHDRRDRRPARDPPGAPRRLALSQFQALAALLRAL